MRRGAEYNLLISLPLLPLRKLGRVPGGRTVARPAGVAWHLPLRLRRRSQFGRPKAANDIAGAAPVLARPRSLDEPLRSLHSILLSASSNVLPSLRGSPCTSLAWLSPPISRPGLKMKRGAGALFGRSSEPCCCCQRWLSASTAAANPRKNSIFVDSRHNKKWTNSFFGSDRYHHGGATRQASSIECDRGAAADSTAAAKTRHGF